jgi:hypothetical protein
MSDYEDVYGEGNSHAYMTGKPCIVAGCNGPGGTAWSPLWCVKHNISRMKQIEEPKGAGTDCTRHGMKRSAPLQRKTPLKRGSWKSSPVSSTDWRTQLRSGGIKTRNRKPTVAEGSKYLAACRGEPCFLRMYGCLGSGETVVPCHSNQAKHGKGMGLKAKHEFTVPGCANCHALIDQGPGLREHKFAAWDVAYEAWEPVRARKMGIDQLEAA